MYTVKVYFQDTELTAEYTKKMRLSDIFTDNKIPFNMPCGGCRRCGKCVVHAKGKLNKMSTQEAELIQKAHINLSADGLPVRLACFCEIVGDAEIHIPYSKSDAPKMAALPDIKNLYDDTDPNALGIAADIGTTTITLQLFHLSSRRLLSTLHQVNSQGYAGADVLSRIEYSARHGYKKLCDTVLQQIDTMISAALEDASALPKLLRRMVVTGNTTMLHFFAGLDPQGIGAAPFKAQSLFGEAYTAAELGLSAYGGCDIYLPKCFGAYTGADLLCGISALGFADDNSKSFLVDIGTNGEMALAIDGKLLCCAAPAGPAMEGANISMGMPALPGAVYSVGLGDSGILIKTIDDTAAVGICGSGLISAAAFMAENEIIDESGAIQKDGHNFTEYLCGHNGEISFKLGSSSVLITQKDIRNLQLAKSAIAAGVDSLIHEAGIKPSDLDSFCISGGFGSYIDPKAAAAIGLIPKEVLPMLMLPGNTALAGAVEMLFSLEQRKKSETLPKLCSEIQLSSSSFFMDSYIDNMMFG